jgi:hypothetical protein
VALRPYWPDASPECGPDCRTATDTIASEGSVISVRLPPLQLTHAIDEFPRLVAQLQTPIDPRSSLVRYLSALVAELAYYHVLQWEIDQPRRAKVIPSEAYQQLVETRRSITVAEFTALLGDGTGFFTVEDRGVIVVGLRWHKFLFLGFRGTKFLFDWRINLHARMTPNGVRYGNRYGISLGRLHSGFAEEAIRIGDRLREALQAQNYHPEYTFVSGHSLGGAVAAIVTGLLPGGDRSLCVFGSPRYCDAGGYEVCPCLHHPYGTLPVHIRRAGDMVPTIPPRLFGYADLPVEFTTSGERFSDHDTYRRLGRDIVRWLRFAAGMGEPHSMEAYRREVGAAAQITGASMPLTPFVKLTKKDTKTAP